MTDYLDYQEYQEPEYLDDPSYFESLSEPTEDYNDQAYFDYMESCVPPEETTPYDPSYEAIESLYQDSHINTPPAQNSPVTSLCEPHREVVYLSNKGGLVRYTEWLSGDSKIACVAGNVTIFKEGIGNSYPRRIFVFWRDRKQSEIPEMLRVLEDNEDAMRLFINYLLIHEQNEYEFDEMDTLIKTCLDAVE